MMSISDLDSIPLPAEYQRIEYALGNHTASNIDTGIPGDNDNLRFLFSVSANRFSEYARFFGNYIDEASNCWRVIYSTIDTDFYVCHNVRAGASPRIRLDSSAVDRKLTFYLSDEESYCLVDGEKFFRNSNGYKDGTTNNTNIDFGERKVSTGSTSSSSRRKWYYFRAWDGNTLIRNYLPCYRKSDNKVGFYDTVNKTFNLSTGSADFMLP